MNIRTLIDDVKAELKAGENLLDNVIARLCHLHNSGETNESEHAQLVQDAHDALPPEQKSA